MLQIRDVPEDLHRKLKARAAMAGTSLCTSSVERVGSMPQPSQSVAISMVSRRISAARSARVVNACLLAMRKKHS